MRWLDGITNTMDMSLRKLQEDSEGQGVLVFIGCAAVHRVTEPDTTTEQQQYIYDWNYM